MIFAFGDNFIVLHIGQTHHSKFLSILNCVNVFSVSAGLIVHHMDLIILLVIDVCNVFVLAFDSIDAGTVELIFVSVLVIAVLIIVLVLQLVVVATLTINIDELRILSFNQLRLQGVNDLLSVFNLHQVLFVRLADVLVVSVNQLKQLLVFNVLLLL